MCLCRDGISPCISNTTPEMLALLADALRDETIDGIHIHDAKAEMTQGPDYESVIRVRLLLDDPPPNARVWPNASIRKMQDLAWKIAADLGITEWSWNSWVALSDAALVNWGRPVSGGR